MEKLLSFAVPTYNMESYLEKCIRSCICENVKKLEIIVVNDGSTDNSLNIAYRLREEFSDIVTVIDKKNGHYGSCVNSALAVARGKYFRMLDPDDWCDTDALNKYIESLKSMDSDLIVSVAEDWLGGKELLLRMDIPSTVVEGKVYNARTFDGIKMGAKWMYCSHVMTYKTNILRKINLTLQCGICYTDNEYVFYPLDRINTITFLNLPIYQYYVGREGASTSESASLKMQKEMWQVLKPICQYYQAHLDNNTDSVCNNQRILIAEMAKWILAPTFLYCHKLEKESETIMQEVQNQIVKDEKLRVMIESYFANAPVPLYSYYCKNGKIWNYTPYICFRLFLYKAKEVLNKL